MSPTETKLCKALDLCQPSRHRSLTFQLWLESKRDHLPYLLLLACDCQDALRTVPGKETLQKSQRPSTVCCCSPAFHWALPSCQCHAKWSSKMLHLTLKMVHVHIIIPTVKTGKKQFRDANWNWWVVGLEFLPPPPPPLPILQSTHCGPTEQFIFFLRTKCSLLLYLSVLPLFG